METTFTKQIQTIRNVRTLVAADNNLLNALAVAANSPIEEIDKALNDAGSSVTALSLDYGNKKRAVDLIERLIDRLNKAGDSSEAKDEAINYVVSFKR